MSKLPIASNANLWMVCAASVTAPKIPMVDGEMSEARKEGLAFHELSELMLPPHRKGDELIGQLSKHGIPFDDDMFYSARDYVTDILKVYNQAELKKRSIHVESYIDTKAFCAGTHGYIDAHVYDPVNKRVTIWDAKYGHTVVEVEENWQLLEYAICIAETPIDYSGYTFDLRVFQPRAHHRDGVCRSWEVSYAELMEYKTAMVSQVRNILTPQPKCTTSPKCYKANCRHACESFQRVAYKAMDVIETYAHSDLKGASLSTEIIALRVAQDVVKARLVGLEEQAIYEHRNGEHLPGLMAIQREGRLNWRKDIDQQEVIDMGDLMGVDLRKPRELSTPAQVIKKGVDVSVIESYSEKPKQGWKLQAVTEDRISKMFKGVK